MRGSLEHTRVCLSGCVLLCTPHAAAAWPLESKGHVPAGLAAMGDLTYRHVFGGNDTTTDIRQQAMLLQPRGDATDDLLAGHMQDLAPQQQVHAAEPQTGRCGSTTAGHCANVWYTALS